MTERRISVSQIGVFMSCPYKWNLQYNRKLRSKRGEVSASTLGDATHYAIAAGLKVWWEVSRRDPPIDTDTAWQIIDDAISSAVSEWDARNTPEDYLSAVETEDDEELIIIVQPPSRDEWYDMLHKAYHLAIRLLKHMNIVEYYSVASLIIEGQEYPAVEFELLADVDGTEYTFVGIVDAVLYDSRVGDYAVFDWKVRQKLQGSEPEQLSMQIGLYQYAIERAFGLYVPLGVVYQIKADVPKTPKINADGSISRSKIATDWDTYRQAVTDAGLDPAEYEDMIDRFAKYEWYRPIIIVRTPEIQQKLWANMVSHTKRIEAETEYPKALSYACRYCPFNNLCIGEIYGYDLDEIIENEYEYKEPNVMREDKID